jgi:DNA primase
MDSKEIKGSQCISRVIGRYVQLQKKGGKLVGLCPFHDDHHPSLVVDVKRQTFVCFACGEKGDVFGFVQRLNGCTFAEAKALLTPVGVSPEPVAPKVVPRDMSARPLKAVALTDGQRRDNEAFLASLDPNVPCPPELVAAYLAAEVGIAPPFAPEAMKAMRGRLIFPIRTDDGLLTGFAARDLSGGGGQPKYINSSASSGFRKGETLYGLHRAKESLADGELYVVEGYKDCLAMQAAGFGNTVALMSATLADGQRQLLRRYGVRRLFVLMDGDRAGREAAAKIAAEVEGAVVVALPEGEDPDSLFRQLGRERFAAFVRFASHPPRFSEQRLMATCLLHPALEIEVGGASYPLPVALKAMLEGDDLPFAYPPYNTLLRHLADGEGEMDSALKETVSLTTAPYLDTSPLLALHHRSTLYLYYEERLAERIRTVCDSAKLREAIMLYRHASRLLRRPGAL